jgi:N-acetylglucosamine-6-sulfatase
MTTRDWCSASRTPAARAGSTVDALVAAIDIAPTIVQFAATDAGAHIQGTAFLPLLTGASARGAGRRSVFIEHYSDDRPMPCVLDADYRAIRTDRYKLIHWVRHPEFDELYDLAADPREDRNIIAEHGIHALV